MDRIIYTRCSPWIDILKEGQINKSEGFGVAAISQDFFNGTLDCNKKLLLKYIEERKCDPNCYEKVYEYALIGNEKYILNAISELPLCLENRPNGNSHRPIFMSEAIVGSFKNKPGFYLNRDNFKGDIKSQNDYYRLDYGIDKKLLVLDQVDEDKLIKQSFNESILNQQTIEKLEKILCFVIEQLNLPSHLQRPLFIKEENENVINYIRLLNECLPTQLAVKLSFLTHTTSFKNNPERYAYYVNKNNVISEYNAYVAELKPDRLVKYLIIGYTKGNIVKNPNSEFEVIDEKGSSYNPVIGLFIHDIVRRDACAIKFLNYIENSQDGILPNNVDAQYELYKKINNFDSNMSHYEAITFINEFKNSVFFQDYRCLEMVMDNIKAYYDVNQDINNNFILLENIKNIDSAYANQIVKSLYQKLYVGFQYELISVDIMKLYEKLLNKGYINQKVKNEIVIPFISVEKLKKLVNSNYDIDFIKEYLKLFFEFIEYNQIIIKNNFDYIDVFKLIIDKYIDDNDIILLINHYLKNKNIDTQEIFEGLIKQAVEEQNDVKINQLINVYKPGLTEAEKIIFLSKYDSTKSFSTYENEYILKVNQNLNQIKRYGDVLLKLIVSMPMEKNNPNSGLQFAASILKQIVNTSVDNYYIDLIEYLDKLKCIKVSNDEKLLNDMIITLNYEILQLGLKSESVNFRLKETANRLAKLGGKSLSIIYRLEEKSKSVIKNDDIVLILSENNNACLNISYEFLSKPLIQKIIKKFDFENENIHFSFVKMFAQEKQLEKFISMYIDIIINNNELDGLVFYYSLCKIVSNKLLNDYQKNICDIIKNILNSNNNIIEKCYDKKYEKKIKSFKAKDNNDNNALNLLIDNFTKYAEKNKKKHGFLWPFR